MQYQVITAATVGQLVDLVNAAIAKGWKPQGGITADGSYRLVMQAMVR